MYAPPNDCFIPPPTRDHLAGRQTVQVALKLPRHGVPGCLDLRSSPLGRITKSEMWYPRRLPFSAGGFARSEKVATPKPARALFSLIAAIHAAKLMPGEMSFTLAFQGPIVGEDH